MKTFAKKIYLPICLLCFLVTACGVQFQEVKLYEGVEAEVKEPRPERVSQAVEPVIFQEDASYFWLPADMPCTTGGLESQVKHTGDNALKIEWNRDPSLCDWAGFGIGWDNWAGKDLSTIFDYAAIQMYARTVEGKMFGLPVVLTLEDYSGNMAWSYVGSSYFERYYLDEEWQKIEIPLNTFDLNEDGLDITNVKQLMFELQQSGSVYLDDIQLVYYDPKPKEIWLPDAPTAPTVNYPVQLFDDGFINDNGWGIFQDNCQDIELTSSTYSEGQRAIHATWDSSKEDCYQVKIGVSWTKWFHTDISNVKENLVISFDIKGSNTLITDSSLRIGLEDYERRTSFVTLSNVYLEGGSLQADQWQTVKIPVADLPAGLDYSDIKQLMIMMDKAGEVYLDNIRLEVNAS
jgi:hypothetical protein